MQSKAAIAPIAVLVVVVTSMLIAGCTMATNPSENQAVSPSSVASTPASTATPTPTSTQKASSTPTVVAVVTVIPTPIQSQRIATSINPYVPPVWYGGGLLPNAGNYYVKQGNYAVAAVVINAADGSHPCRPLVSYYIDHQAAGGEWYIPEDSPYGCSGGASPHMELILHPEDTARFAVGKHMFQISYPGNSKYAPAEYVYEFFVEK